MKSFLIIDDDKTLLSQIKNQKNNNQIIHFLNPNIMSVHEYTETHKNIFSVVIINHKLPNHRYLLETINKNNLSNNQLIIMIGETIASKDLSVLYENGLKLFIDKSYIDWIRVINIITFIINL